MDAFGDGGHGPAIDHSLFDPPPPLDPLLHPGDVDPVAPPHIPAFVPPQPHAGEAPAFNPLRDVVVAGTPGQDMTHFHCQGPGGTCAIAAQEFVLDALCGEATESQLRTEAEANHWFTPGSGTPPLDVGNLLISHGVLVDRHAGCTIEEIQQRLQLHQKILVGVDSEELWDPGIHPRDDLLGDLPHMPGQGADHVVEVIGIATHDGQQMVVTNDSGHQEGQGRMVPIDEFRDAMQDSGGLIVAAGPGVTGTDEFPAARNPHAWPVPTHSWQPADIDGTDTVSWPSPSAPSPAPGAPGVS